MNELQTMTFSSNLTVRSLSYYNENTGEYDPWFVGRDVADTLGYRNGSRDINRHVAEEDRRKEMIFDGNQRKETIIINESGVFSLILGSNLDSAKRFKRWVTSEVLPQIRRTGRYVPQDTTAHKYILPPPEQPKDDFFDRIDVDDIIGRTTEEVYNFYITTTDHPYSRIGFGRLIGDRLGVHAGVVSRRGKKMRIYVKNERG